VFNGVYIYAQLKFHFYSLSMYKGMPPKLGLQHRWASPFGDGRLTSLDLECLFPFFSGFFLLTFFVSSVRVLKVTRMLILLTQENRQHNSMSAT